MTYFTYFDEFITEELLSNLELTEAAKEGVFKDNYYLRDHLQIPYIHDVLAKPVTQDKIIDFTGLFIDQHNEQLSTSGPVKMFTFGGKDVEFFYQLFGVTSQDMLNMYDKVVEETYFGTISKHISGWVKHAPHKILITAILIDALQNGYDDIVECCEYIWAFCEYPILYKKFWPYGVKADVMDSTIEHLGAKYKIVQNKMKNLKELLKFHATTSVNSQASRLKTGADNTYIDFFQRIRNQMKNSFLNIAREYKKNNDENKTTHTRGGTFNDGTVADQEGITSNMTQVIDATINKFISGGINGQMVGIAANGSQVDKSNLTGYLNQIWAVKTNRMPKFIEDIITAYYNKNPTNNGLGNNEFLNFGLSLFRSLGSNDPINQEIKSILDMWMDNIIEISKYYTRPGTISAYTRAVYNYVVLMIMHYN